MGMRRAVMMTMAGLGLAAGAARAQCPTVAAGAPATDPTRVTSDACNKAADLFQFMVPQLAVIQAGGNPSPSIGGTLGGFPHVNVGVRVNAIRGALPRIDQASPGLSVNGKVASNIPTDDAILAMPTVDAQIGLFQGFKLGLPLPFLGITNILGVDALLNAAYLPNASAKTGSAGLDLQAGKVAIGYGARVGIFEESLLAPGLAFSYVSRPMPAFSLYGTVQNDTLGLQNFKLTTNSWRLTASKTIPILGLGVSAGYGQDKLDGSTGLALTINEAAPINRVATTASVAQTATRTNYFVGAHWRILLLRLSGEVGWVTGGVNPTLSNQFTKGGSAVNPMDKRMYASIAARLGI